MSDEFEQILSELAPEGLGPEGPNWQQRKSSQTRIAILEAAIDCLEKYGYARTTTQLIAKVGQISRGAMLHHYATKQELMAALIDYTMYRRLQQFMTRIGSLSEVRRVENVAGVELYWEGLLSREFTAYLELSIAARTDPELRAIFLPKARRFDRIEHQHVVRAFPEWASKPEAYSLAMDFCTAAIEGLLLNREVWQQETRRQALRDLVSQVLLMLREGKIPAAC